MRTPLVVLVLEDLQQDLQVHGVLLGDWSRGQTLTIGSASEVLNADRKESSLPAVNHGPSRLAVLSGPDAAGLLAALGEAQTGQPIHMPAPAADSPLVGEGITEEPGPADDRNLIPAGDAEAASDRTGGELITTRDTGAPARRMAGERVQVRVLGEPVILDRDGNPVPGLR